MAKSVGNIFLLREVLDRYDPAVRAHVLPHDALPQPARVLDREARRGEGGLRAASPVPCATSTSASPTRARPREPRRVRRTCAARRGARRRFAEHMDDDLNTAGAIGELFGLVGDMYRYLAASTAARSRSTPRRAGPSATPCARRSACCSSPCGRRRRITSAARSPARTPRLRTGASRCRRPPASPWRAAGTTSSSSTPTAGVRRRDLRRVLRDHERAEKNWAAPTPCATRSRRPASRCATRRRAPRSCRKCGRSELREQRPPRSRRDPACRRRPR